MKDEKLVIAYDQENPSKFFIICDLHEGKKFIDPILLFDSQCYDSGDVNKEGLYAIGGNIDITTLLSSYKWGIFPWYPYKLTDEIHWYCPRQRFVIIPEEIHVGHSLRNLLNKNRYHITINQSFREVINKCRKVGERDDNEMAWLGESLEKCFIELNKLGYAKSIEVWNEGELIGGFYGFWYKGVFQGESMFSLKPSASQIGLVLLCRDPFIEGKKIKFIDTQFETQTFKRLGAKFISYRLYREIMENP